MNCRKWRTTGIHSGSQALRMPQPLASLKEQLCWEKLALPKVATRTYLLLVLIAVMLVQVPVRGSYLSALGHTKRNQSSITLGSKTTQKAKKIRRFEARQLGPTHEMPKDPRLV